MGSRIAVICERSSLIFLQVKETPLTDHVDDVILLGYGLVALYFVKDFVREFKKHPLMIGLGVCGFGMFFLMVCADFLSNNTETFIYIFQSLLSGDLVHMRDICRMADESFQLIGEAFFLSAFVAAFAHIKETLGRPLK